MWNLFFIDLKDNSLWEFSFNKSLFMFIPETNRLCLPSAAAGVTKREDMGGRRKTLGVHGSGWVVILGGIFGAIEPIFLAPRVTLGQGSQLNKIITGTSPKL